MPLGAAPGAAAWTSPVRGSARRHDRAPLARTGSPLVTPPKTPKGRIGASGATMTTVSRGRSFARSFVGLRARGPLAPLPAAADALNGASPSPPPADAPKLYPNLDLDFVPAMTPAEWARGAAVAALAALLHAAFVAKLLSRKLRDAGAPWHVAAAPTVAVAVLVFLLHRYRTLEAKEQARLIPEAAAADADSLFEPMALFGDEDSTVRVHYKLRRPSRPGPPRFIVTCCHGFGANAWSWEKATLAQLATALDATVVAHDSPGFGLTSRPTNLGWYVPTANAAIARRMLDVAARAHQSLDELTRGGRAKDRPGFRRVVVGHSMGGVAAVLAAGAGDVDDVVLVAPALVPPRGDARTTTPGESSPAAALMGAFGRFLTATLAHAFAPFLKVVLRVFVRSASFWRRGLAKAVGRASAQKLLFEDLAWADGYRRPSCVRGWDDGMARVVVAACTGGVNDVWANERKRVARAFKGADGVDSGVDSGADGDERSGATDAAATLDALRASGARVLIVHGDEDSIVPLSNSRRLADALPGSTLAVMRGCGHMPHEEDPDAFVDLVKSFVESPVS